VRRSSGAAHKHQAYLALLPKSIGMAAPSMDHAPLELRLERPIPVQKCPTFPGTFSAWRIFVCVMVKLSL